MQNDLAFSGMTSAFVAWRNPNLSHQALSARRHHR